MLNILIIIYCIIGMIILISLSILAYNTDKEAFIEWTTKLKRTYWYYNKYNLRKRIVWYILSWPLWIIWIAFIILY
jgi:hypothetical protein